MDKLDLTNLRAALAEYDAGKPARDQMLDNAQSDLDVEKWRELEDGAAEKVRVAFYEDSKDRNSLSNCQACSLQWLRGLTMEPPPMTIYIVAGIGVREGRYAKADASPQLRLRMRDGRQQVLVHVVKNARSQGYVYTEQQWVDGALIFTNWGAAVDLYRRARRHAPTIGKTIWAAAIDLVNTDATLHPAWPGNQ